MDGTPKLIILSEQFRGRTFELTAENTSVGRVDQCDICIKDPTVSTNHCSIILRDGICIVVDNGSTNGTRINGNQLEPGVETQLNNTDVLQVGGIEMLYDSDDKSVTTLMRTSTNIDINANEGTQTLQRIDTSAFSRKNNGEKSQKAFVIIIILLSILVVGMVALIAMKVLGSDSKNVAVPNVQAAEVQNL